MEKERKLIVLGSPQGGGGTQVQSDWNETNTSSPAFIKNKPTVRSVIEVSDMTQTELLDFYTNYATLMGQNTYVIEGYPFTTTTVTTQGMTVLILEYQITLMDSTGGAPADTVVSNLKTAWVLPDGTISIGAIGPVTMPAASYISTVGHTGSYNDLTDKPTIPTLVQPDWTQSDTTAPDYIKYKPPFPQTSVLNQSATPVLDIDESVIITCTVPVTSMTINRVSGNSYESNVYFTTGNTPFTMTVPNTLDGIVGSTSLMSNTDYIVTIKDNRLFITYNGYTGESEGANQWFGTQTEFDNLGTYDENTDYYIKDKIDYNTDIVHKPDLSVYATKTDNARQDNEIANRLTGVFMTQQEFDTMGQNVPEGENYFIEGNTVEVVVTFTDQSTATYNVVVD